jgi:hypothetical protein
MTVLCLTLARPARLRTSVSHCTRYPPPPPPAFLQCERGRRESIHRDTRLPLDTLFLGSLSCNQHRIVILPLFHSLYCYHTLTIRPNLRHNPQRRRAHHYLRDNTSTPFLIAFAFSHRLELHRHPSQTRTFYPLADTTFERTTSSRETACWELASSSPHNFSRQASYGVDSGNSLA